MAFAKHRLLSYLSLLASLIACSGMNPGGGSPAEVGQGGGGTTIANSLDAVGGSGAPGGGLPGSEGGSGGAAVPSTQQSTEAIGAPCILTFRVTVKTLRNGVEEACQGQTARMIDDFGDTGSDTVQPPDLHTGPTVNMKLSVGEDSPFNAEETHATQCLNGRWQSADNFLFRFPGNALDCSNYKVSAQAHWYKDSKSFSSNLFQGPPVPAQDENNLYPLELTIELGASPVDTNVNVNNNLELSL